MDKLEKLVVSGKEIDRQLAASIIFIVTNY